MRAVDWVGPQRESIREGSAKMDDALRNRIRAYMSESNSDPLWLDGARQASGAGVSNTTTALPPGKARTAYVAVSLAVTGGTAPYSWALTSGILPVGLTLTAEDAISGMPTTDGSAAPLTFRVTDSSSPFTDATKNQRTSVGLTLTIN